MNRKRPFYILEMPLIKKNFYQNKKLMMHLTLFDLVKKLFFFFKLYFFFTNIRIMMGLLINLNFAR